MKVLSAGSGSASKNATVDAKAWQTNANLAVACVVLFCAEASRGLFIPSLWSCVQHIGQTHAFLAWCIPIFSIGRMVGSYAAGVASDRMRDDGLPTLACVIASILGGCVYICADMNYSWVLLLLAEFLLGAGGGTLAVLRAHVSKITTDRQRLTHTTCISTAQFAGLGLMPLAALAINYYFVGPQHHEEHAAHRDAILASAASGFLADTFVNSMTGAHSSAVAIAPHKEFHAGLENSNRYGHKTTMIHAAKQPLGHDGHGQWHGRHLLSTVSSAAVSTVGPLAVHPESSVGVLETAEALKDVAPSFWHRLVNHRTAPAHLLIALNLACLLMYFFYFNPDHESAEYAEKKKLEAAKRKLADQMAGSKSAGKQFDVDNESAGTNSAFAESSKEFPTSSVGRTKQQPVKEIVFDTSKLNFSSPATPNDEPATDTDATEPTPAASSSKITIVQVSDTTVITLAPFSADPTATFSSFSSASLPESPVPSSSNNVELNSRKSKRTDATDFKSVASYFGRMGEVATALLNVLQSPPVEKTRSVNADTSSSKEILYPTGAHQPQSSRIAAYERGDARIDEDEHEGIYLGRFHLTPERMVFIGSCLFVYLNYAIRGVLATVETIGTPTLAHLHHIPAGSPLEVEVSARFFGVLGLLGCAVFFAQWYFQDRGLDEPTCLIAGFVVTLLGSLTILFFHTTETGFVFGCVCIWSFGLPAVQNSVLAALSRILGTRPQGAWMGWIQTFGSLGRVTFPLFTQLFGIAFSFLLASAGCAIAIVALIVYMRLAKLAM